MRTRRKASVLALLLAVLACACAAADPATRLESGRPALISLPLPLDVVVAEADVLVRIAALDHVGAPVASPAAVIDMPWAVFDELTQQLHALPVFPSHALPARFEVTVTFALALGLPEVSLHIDVAAPGLHHHTLCGASIHPPMHSAVLRARVPPRAACRPAGRRAAARHTALVPGRRHGPGPAGFVPAVCQKIIAPWLS